MAIASGWAHDLDVVYQPREAPALPMRFAKLPVVTPSQKLGSAVAHLVAVSICLAVSQNASLSPNPSFIAAPTRFSRCYTENQTHGVAK